nr:MAG TPA: helix-turn-helix domain protein [Caudoviricetes sp.]
MNNTNTNVYLTTKELSKRWKINPNTIEHWRTQGFGPEFIRIGRKILYSLDSIIAFENKRKAQNTAENKQSLLSA